MNDRSHDSYTFEEIEILQTTQKAILVRQGMIGRVWVPKSQILYEYTDLADRILVTTGWWAREARAKHQERP